MLLLKALLLVSLCVLCHGEESRDTSVGMSNIVKFHEADLFQHKCNSLLYRSVLIDDLCYFAVKGNITYEYAQRYCEDAIDKSTFYTKKDAAGLLALMMLKSSDYHSSTTQNEIKSVLCRYENPFSCKPDERREMRGRCVTKIDVKKTFKEASKHCYELKSQLPSIHDDQENSAVAAIVHQSSSPSPFWIDQTAVGARWKAASSSVQYFYWLVGKTPLPLKCNVDTAVAAVSTKNPINGCVAYAKWEPTAQSEQRQVVCVRPTDSDFNHAALTLLATTVPTTTLPPYPKNNPPKPEWTWVLSYYYNWGRILHGFCADSVGCNQMFSNGIGYDRSRGSGPLGRTISRDGMKRMPEVCAENYGKLKPLSFRLNGVGYLYNFDNQGIFAGYVAETAGLCGASAPIRVWSCLVSRDAMYAENLEGNTWYRGRYWGWNPRFYLWR